MPYPFHLLRNEKIPASSHDVEIFIRHALGQHFFLIEKANLDETNKRYQLHFWQRDIVLDQYLEEGKIGKVYWGGCEIIEWSNLTEIVRMWVATPEDWYVGEFNLSKDKVMEERFGWLEELSKEIQEHFSLILEENNKEEIMANNSAENINIQRNVFVVHGRNEALRRALFDFLRAIKLYPIEWSEAIEMTGKGSPYIGDVLDVAMKQAQAIVVLLTGDDEVKLKDEFLGENDPDFERKFTLQARPNVLFEAGMSFGKYPDRTILVQIGSMRPFSDIAGRHIIHFSDTIESRQNLATRLETAGCLVNIKGSDWHSAGKFSHQDKKKKTARPKKKPNEKIDSTKKTLKESSLVEKISKEYFLPIEAINILILFSKPPDYSFGGITIEWLSLVTSINPLRVKKHCELLVEKEFIFSSDNWPNEYRYQITSIGEKFLLETGLV